MNGRIYFVGGPFDGLEIVANYYPAVAVRVGITDMGCNVLVPSMILHEYDREVYASVTQWSPAHRLTYEWRYPQPNVLQ